MTKQELIQLQAAAQGHAGLNVVADAGFNGQSLFPYPFLDGQTKAVGLAAAMSFSVTGGAGFHTVVIAARIGGNGDTEYFVWCGDAYLEGRRDVAGGIVVADSIPQTNPKKPAIVQAIREANAKAPKNGGCNFWARWKSGKGPCKHVDAVLYGIGDMAGVCDDLDKALREWISDGVFSPAIQWLLGLAQPQQQLKAA